MKFIDSILMNSGGKVVKVLAGSYDSLVLRFAGTQSGATAPTPSTLGYILLHYRGKQRGRISLQELEYYCAAKGGSLEKTQSAGNGQAFAFTYVLDFHHPDDKKNILYVGNDDEFRLEWIPDSALASRVDSSSTFRIVGVEKAGIMSYFWGAGRDDIAMVAGDTTPKDLLPHNISSIFVEYNTNIDNLDIVVDGKTVVQSAEVVELNNYHSYQNRLETYAASGYFEVDLNKSRSRLETLNNSVKLQLRGSSADTISVFWRYFDYQAVAQEQSLAQYRQQRQEALSRKALYGGSGAVQALSRAFIEPEL